jgi:hypothetical protein
MDYRVYFVGRDGHFSSVQEIECVDDQGALVRAMGVSQGHEVEVWRRDRCMVILNGREAREA